MPKSVRYKLYKSTSKKKKNKKSSVVGVKDKSNRRRFLLKICRICLIIIGALLLVYWIFVSYKTVRDVKIVDVVGQNNEIVKLLSQNDKVRKTLIIYEDPSTNKLKNLFLLVVIYNSDTSEVLMYYLPESLHIIEDFSNKQVSIANLSYAGESYMYNEKYAYVLRQIEEQLAISFDSYIWFGLEVSRNFVSGSDYWGYKKDDVLQLFNKLSFLNLMPKYYKIYLFEEYLHSNMSFFEMYTYFQSIKGVIASKNYTYFDLGEEAMVDSVVLGTGKSVKSLNLQAFDKSLRENIDVLRARELRREHVKVEVYNGTEIPGYANIIARRIHNAGCRVIRYENSSVLYNETHIYISDIEKFANGLNVVQSILEDYVVVEGRPDFLTTGDIVVVLGAK